MTDEFLPSRFFDIEPTTVDSLREKFRKHMDSLRAMDVFELTLHKKWMEVQDYQSMVNRSQVVKSKIWTPTDFANKEQTVAEVRALKPRIRFVNPTDLALMNEWLMLRVFCHSMDFEQNPGRFFRFVVEDEVTGKYLGATSIGSDVISIKCRDAWIGWERVYRTTSGRLNNSCIGTCIMACQPFGYNFLGGKLVASLMVDSVVANAWKEQTGDRLAGLTTTSLYGGVSMYNGIPYWYKLGETEGKIYIKPDDAVYKEWHHWLQENKPDEYRKATFKEGINGPVTGIKQKILDLVFKTSGIQASKYAHGFKRGVYYAPLYQNTKEFLRGDIDEAALIPHPRLRNGTQGIIDWWIEKAVNRYTKLYDEKRIKPEILYYNDGIGMTWHDFKNQYLGEVGR